MKTSIRSLESFDARGETRPRFLERVCERFGHEVAIAVGEGFFLLFYSGARRFSLVVMDAPALVRFLCCYGATSLASPN